MADLFFPRVLLVGLLLFSALGLTACVRPIRSKAPSAASRNQTCPGGPGPGGPLQTSRGRGAGLLER